MSLQVGRNAVFNEFIFELPVTMALIVEKVKMMNIALKDNQLDWKIYIPKHMTSKCKS